MTVTVNGMQSARLCGRLCRQVSFSPHENSKLGSSSYRPLLNPPSAKPTEKLVSSLTSCWWHSWDRPAQAEPFRMPRALATAQTFYALKAKEQMDTLSQRFLKQRKRELHILAPPRAFWHVSRSPFCSDFSRARVITAESDREQLKTGLSSPQTEQTSLKLP